MIRAILLVFLPAVLGACGYHMGYRPRPGLRTIAVPIAENSSLRREVEFPLTEAIVREIQRRTPLVVVSDERAADATLKVTITRFTERVLVEGKNDEVLESAAQITLDVKLIERGGVEAVSRRIAEMAEFPVANGTRFGEATPEALARLAERVVMLLEEPPAGR
jgi:outer membrane lipopolysaccharide assembly protein LptE/RlpB